MLEISNSPATKWGDFSMNAVEYGQRPPYSPVVLGLLTRTVASIFGDAVIAELGAGTGNLLRSFDSERVTGFAVEPNDAMRAVAHRLAPHKSRFTWVSGTAESSQLPDNSANWVLLGNAYQFVAPSKMFREAHRILQGHGFLTIVWNLRDFKRDGLQRQIEEMVKREVPDLKRTGTSVDDIMDAVDTEGLFSEYCYLEARHEQNLTPQHFLDTWKAGHDVPSQVSKEVWKDILSKTAKMIPSETLIRTLWITRAWTFQAT
ncbi:methyltransferase domain-containing protein [Bradyrhizobium sp. BEA-2-5]|uniref:class I SAM-dependent methyltransferase n=1 Tax=Bradyrhizobium sp. BEA-2-5 TaxID=3080015 RepID=UPI00293E0106|nr:methyltransferase domain-containing protein [Bradyrhizobium sp. BEA-2-5]WOH80291.1 methyltransferase domain-containing protein [Bradyrhizobium sp. BEA-2-5]